MVANTVSESELAERLPEILEQVNAGERFNVEREGKFVVAITPPLIDPSLTVGELRERFSGRPVFEDWEPSSWPTGWRAR